MRTLEELSGLVIIDEIQRRPDVFELLRVLVDRSHNPARFLILGSASPGLVKGVSESLAGRIGFIDLSGFDLREVGPEQRSRLWIRGGFPKSFLADDDISSMTWREDFIRTFLERDIPQLGITIPAETLRRFWTMISHYHGQVWNASHFARSLGTSEKTARRYLDILAGAFMVRILPPWFENIRKRQVKAPKIYIRDSGIMHALLQINTMADLQGHPKLGSSWEGFCLEQVIGGKGTRDDYFWATHAGAELDLLVTVAGKRYGFEFKYSDAPGSSRSMHIAIEDLELEPPTKQNECITFFFRYSGISQIATCPQGSVNPINSRSIINRIEEEFKCTMRLGAVLRRKGQHDNFSFLNLKLDHCRLI